MLLLSLADLASDLFGQSLCGSGVERLKTVIKPMASMGPLANAGGFEIIRIGNGLALGSMGLFEAIGQAVFLRIGNGLLGTVEPELDLCSGVARADPAHEGLGLGGLFALKLQKPAMGLGCPRLGGGFGGAIDPCSHKGCPFKRHIGALFFD